MSSKRVLVVAILALAFSIIAFTGSVLQFSLVVSEAIAQSSVRPPDDAVNVQTTAGGSVRPPADAATNAPMQPGVGRVRDAIEGSELPGGVQIGTRGANSLSTLWGEIRSGAETSVSIPDKRAAVLVQDAGMGWLEWRAKGGPLQVWGGYALLGMIGILVLFYLLRGRIRIEAGRTDATIERFNALERFGHWVLAVSFILLALSGLNLLYGKDWIMPLIGKDSFAQITLAGKWVHNNVAWAFMAALVLVFVLWVRHNIPSPIDLEWLAKGGGLFSKGVHPPSRKFNAGQKIIFWAVILLGASVSLSGISLLFPYEMPLFAKTFAILNEPKLGHLVTGGPLATDLTAIQEMQYAQLWHTVIAFAMIFIIIAHIYIGSVGMEGAFAAMGSGQVDRNWAKEHHGLWVAEEDAKSSQAPGGAAATPAE